MDIKKTFDSLDHDFLNSTLRKFGCGKNFMACRKILLKDKLSCFMNSGTTTQYFNLEGGTSQSGPISVYLFILTLEILFLLIKKHPGIKDMKIFEHCFLYTTNADVTKFLFLNDPQSITLPS